MGCGCNKGGNDQDRAQKNLIEAENKKRNLVPEEMNKPSFPVIPQLNRTRTANVDPKVSTEDKLSSEPLTPEQPKFMDKVKNFGKSVTSRALQGKAEESTIKLRVLSCHGDDNMLPCPYRADSDVREGAKYCTACGCGDKPRAFLNNPDDPDAYTKLHYPWVSCPVKMPGFSDYVSVENQPSEITDKYPDGVARKMILEKRLHEQGVVIPDAIPLPEKK